MVYLSPIGGVAGQFFDNNGNPLAGGLLYSYLAGTTTQAPTFTSTSGNIQQPNPIVLDASGRVPGEIWLSGGVSYKFVLQTSAGVQIGSWDNILGINSGYVAYSLQEQTFVATSGQTVFTLTTMQYIPGVNNLAVYVNGLKQIVGQNYVETSATVVTFTTGLNVGAIVDFITAVPATGSTITNASAITYNEGGTGAVTTTVQAKLQQSVSVMDFGATGNGTTNDTAAIQAAINAIALSGGTINLPPGTYLVDSLIFPTHGGGVPQNVINFIGSGMGSTILLMNSPTEPVIMSSRAIANNASIGNRFSDFSVKANASGSYSNLNHIAIDTIGFCQSFWQRIQFLSNGSGSCGIMFRTSASPQLTYQQVFEGIQVTGQVGPGFVVQGQNTGTYLTNTNILQIRDSWIYANSNMNQAFDLQNIENYEVINNHIESTANYGISLGTNGTIIGNWIENVAVTPITFVSVTSGGTSPASNTIIGNYFSGFSGSINIPSAYSTNNIFINNPGSWTLIGSGQKQVIGAGPVPAAPTLAQTTGTTGTLTLNTATLISTLTQTYELTYNFVPASTSGGIIFTLTPPSGYSITTLNVNCANPATSVPYVTSVQYPDNNFYVAIPSTSAMSINIQVSLQ